MLGLGADELVELVAEHAGALDFFDVNALVLGDDVPQVLEVEAHQVGLARLITVPGLAFLLEEGIEVLLDELGVLGVWFLVENLGLLVLACSSHEIEIIL